MDHVIPDYILGQKKRLEAECRYSAGLLLTVIQCKDFFAGGVCWESPPTPLDKGGEG
jgi:hypothetical protein